MALPRLATAQEVAISPDSAQSQIRAVLRAFYLHLENKNWEALSPYVLSPKLLERRGGPQDPQMVTRDRARSRGSLAPSLFAEDVSGEALGSGGGSGHPARRGLGRGIGFTMQRGLTGSR
jgi:hypothetical protein